MKIKFQCKQCSHIYLLDPEAVKSRIQFHLAENRFYLSLFCMECNHKGTIFTDEMPIEIFNDIILSREKK